MKLSYNIYSSVAVLVGLSLFLMGCGGSKAAATTENTEKAKASEDGPAYTSTANVTVTFKNKNTNVAVTLDPYDEDIYLNLTGTAFKDVEVMNTGNQANQKKPGQNPFNQKPDKPNPYTHPEEAAEAEEKENKKPKIKEGEEYQARELNLPPKERTKAVLKEIQKAQDHFYKKEYDRAIESAKSSIDAKETAQGYSLLGSIYYMKGNVSAAMANWNKALSIDPDMKEVKEMMEKVHQKE